MKPYNTKIKIQTLKEIALVMHQGINTVTEKIHYQETGFPIIQSKHITQKKLDLSDTRFVGDSDFQKYKNKYNPQENDILICNIGTIGKSILITEQVDFLIAWNIFLLRLDNSRILSNYCKHYLDHLCTRNYFDQFLTGGTVKFVNKGNLGAIKIPLPSLEEQKRVAEILDRAEELRSKRREAIAELDTLTQAIFIEMFGDPVTNPFKFPFLPLENVISRSFQNGAYFPKEAYCNEGGVEMIHMSDAFEGIVKRGNLKRVICSQQDIERYKLSNRDLIVARRSLNYEGSVKPCLIPSLNEPLIFESSLIRITPNPEKVKILYLFYYILNPYVRERFIFPFVTQSTISGINQGNLAKVLIMIPPIDLQNEFARRVEALERLKTAHHASLSELDALFASLQHRAFREEL